ncbi:MAG: CdaR family protein [Planctomycetota bacterium]
MARRRGSGNLRYGFMAFVIAIVLWGIAHGSSRAERNVDIPVAFYGLPDDLVITEQSTSEINIRVQGSRAALRNVSPTTLEYPVSVGGAKPGPAIYDVEASYIEPPRGVKVVSRSPARIELKFEARGRKNLRIRPDIEGEPAEGFLLGEIVVEPERVWLTGARSDVFRLTEVLTETVDITGLGKPLEKEVRLALGRGHVWMEETQPVTVRVQIDAIPEPEEEPEGEGEGTQEEG